MTIFLLFFYIVAVGLIVGATAPAPDQQEQCAPFSCGKLHNLTYPFRLKDYPPGCGEEMYQLSCTDDRAIMYINGGTFYVTAVWNSNRTLWLVDPSLQGNSTCHLPSPSLRLSYLDSTILASIGSSWVSFMNCSKPIHNDKTYLSLPCMSQNTSFVYAAIGGSYLKILKPTCRYLTMAPLSVDANDAGAGNLNLTANDLLEIIGKGSAFYLAITDTEDNSRSMAIPHCLGKMISHYYNQIKGKKLFGFIKSLLGSDFDFVNCVADHDSKSSTLVTALVLAFTMMILQFLILILISIRLLFPPMILWTYAALKLWKRMAYIDTVEKFLRNQERLSPTRYTYGEIIVITKNFKDKLGQGGFGSVFKGELLGGVLVAVKLLNNSKYNGEEFINEVSTIGRIHHANVVRLVGYCSEGSKRALVYEYMANGSLDKLIFITNETCVQHLNSLKKLVDIALGVARGIDYLHRGCEMQILHFDIKPHNILLNRNLTPKLSDFGLAKLYPKEDNFISVSAARGTIGYIAPELISRSFGVISYKSDVYSFGMLLLEMAGERRNVDPRAADSSKIYYPSWIYNQLELQKSLDQGNTTTINEVERKLATIGLWCIQLKSSDRPTMSKVIEMLEDDVDNLMIPPNPCFSSMDPISVHQSYFNSTVTD